MDNCLNFITCFWFNYIYTPFLNFWSYPNIQIPSTQGGASSSSSSSAPRKHDVFLSFRGEDTRFAFTGFLYDALVSKGLNVYMDDQKLPIGTIIRTELLQAIEESKSAIVILSENYAGSTWCLDELTKIVECVETRDLILFPVFYRVDPSDVRRQRNNFDLTKYKRNSGIAKDSVDSWRRALGIVGHTAGHHVKGDRYETYYRDEIVRKISEQLEFTLPIGLNEEMRNMESLIRQLTCREDDIKHELVALERQQPVRKSKREVVSYWLERVEMAKAEFESLQQEVGHIDRYSFSHGQLGKRMKRLREKVAFLNEQSNFPDGITIDTYEARGVQFPATGVVLGETFRMNCEVVLGYLKNDQVSSIGIYGMGGVGKTTVMKHVHNQILADPATFGHVCWVTVSQNFSIKRLQYVIFRKLNLNLSSEDDEMSRAASLFDILKKGKYILILDDVWVYIPLEKVGIPIDVSLCKVIVTTRSLDVCNKMICQEKIEISPLFEEEAWELFMEKLGPHEELTLEVIQIAKDVARRCGGLPLAIITMAASMRGVNGIRDWRNALEELKKPEIFASNDINTKVFRVLKYSYNHLGDEESQLCFLSCALYPEDFEIPRDELIKYCIAKGQIRKMESRRAEIDRGHTIFNKLVKCCLLKRGWFYDEEGEEKEYVNMHDLIREMALQIMSKKQQVMVKAGFQLTKIPEEEEWTEDLEVVSLMNNDIIEIPDGWSPMCPNLSALMLQQDKYLTQIPEEEEEEWTEDLEEWMEDLDVVSFIDNDIREIHFTRIPDSFFVQLCGLRVLDLSGNRDLRVLPDSVGDLINLIALWLDGCVKLTHIPSLRKLKKLRDLDFSRTKVEEILDGIGELRSLRCLNMIKTYYPCSVEELRELQQLEEFRGWVRDASDYNVLVRSKWFQQLWAYRLFLSGVGEENWSGDLFYTNEGVENEVFLNNLGLGGRGVVDVPHGIKKMVIWSCHNTGKCLLKFGLRRGNARTRELKEIKINGCKEVEWVVAMPSSSPDVQLPGIEILSVDEMENLEGIFNWWEYCDSTPSIPNRGGGGDYNQSSFSKLKELHIYRCDKMKVGLTVNCLGHLPVLEEIHIAYCSGMEEIIGGGAGEDRENSNGIIISTDIKLPKLRILYLQDLPSLSNVYNRGNIICDSIEEILLRGCTELKMLPLSSSCYGGSPQHPFPSLRMIRMHRSEEEWWKSLELVDPTYHPLLLPFLDFLIV